MALVSEVKCGKCDRMYSSLKPRCPYCGARRNAAGKYARSDENMKGKMIIGIVVLALIAVSVVIILITANSEVPDTEVIASPTPTFDVFISEDVPTTDVMMPAPVTTDAPPSQIPVAAVQTVKVRSIYGDLPGQASGEPGFTMERNEKVKLNLVVTPDGIITELGITPVWVSNNTDVFTIMPSEDGLSATAYWIAKGNGLLTVTVGDKTVTVIVACKN